MLVKMVSNLGWAAFPDHPFREGEEHDVDDALGKRLVRIGAAIDITPESPVIEPEVPMIAVAKEPELKAVPNEPIKPTASAKPKKNGD